MHPFNDLSLRTWHVLQEIYTDTGHLKRLRLEAKGVVLCIDPREDGDQSQVWVYHEEQRLTMPNLCLPGGTPGLPSIEHYDRLLFHFLHVSLPPPGDMPTWILQKLDRAVGPSAQRTLKACQALLTYIAWRADMRAPIVWEVEHGCLESRGFPSQSLFFETANTSLSSSLEDLHLNFIGSTSAHQGPKIAISTEFLTSHEKFCLWEKAKEACSILDQSFECWEALAKDHERRENDRSCL